MKKVYIGATLLVLVLLVVPVALYWFLHRPIPNMSGTESIPGLESGASVIYDKHAIPYIESKVDADVYVAQGYVTARERMFQMDLMRRSALGQLSEVYGSSSLSADRLVRTIGIKRLAFAEWEKLSPAARTALQSYADGVNAYLETNANRLPLEFTLLGYTPHTWRPEDSLAILKYVAYKTDESWRLDDFRQRITNRCGEDIAKELFRDDIVLYGLPKENKPDKKKQDKSDSPAPERGSGRQIGQTQSHDVLSKLATMGDAAHKWNPISPLFGSTAWVVPASASQTNRGLLAAAKDSNFAAPPEWYLCSLNSPTLHVAGASIPGVPGVMVGRNENVSWGSSALKADVQDIYLEQFKSQFDIEYRVQDGWSKAEVVTELIPVRFGKDVEHKVVITRHGPVLMRSQQAAISLAWTGLQTDKPTFETIYKLNRASNLDVFVDALASHSDPPELYVFADRWGNIGGKAVGHIPVRSGGGQGTLLNEGWSSKGFWQSMIPADQLPLSIVTASNSESASKMPIVAANQKPDTTGSAMPKMPASLMLGHQWAPPYRANRLLSAISQSKTKISLADMIALQGDTYSPLAPVIAKSLQEAAVADQVVDRNSVQAIEMLIHWDGQLKATGAEGSIYSAFMQNLIRRSVEPRIGRELTTEYMDRWPLWTTIAHTTMQNKPAFFLPPEERTYSTYMLTTLVQGMKSLRIAFDNSDPSQWTWGKIHQAVFQPLASSAGVWFASYYAIGPVAVSGAAECINSCDVHSDPNGLNYYSSSGPVQRMLIDMSDQDKFYEAIGTGQSGHLFSPYRNDFLQSWSTVDLVPVAFSSTQLVKQAHRRLILEKTY